MPFERRASDATFLLRASSFSILVLSLKFRVAVHILEDTLYKFHHEVIASQIKSEGGASIHVIGLVSRRAFHPAP